MQPRMNPTKSILRPTPNAIRSIDVADMDAFHRDMGYKVIPGRSEDKAQTMSHFGSPGPKRKKNPYAPA